jgi:hypothetical protein
VVAAFGHAFGVRVDGPGGPKVLRVLRVDGACGAEGCGIALRAMSFVIPLRGMKNHTTGLRPQGDSSVLSSWRLSFLKASTTAADRQRIYLRRQPPPQPSAPKGLSNLRTLGAKAPSILRTFSLPSEPGREAKPIPARTHGSARSARTIDPGRREAPEPSCFRKYSLPAPPSAISAAAAIKKEL